jgi:hypothetical protein
MNRTACKGHAEYGHSVSRKRWKKFHWFARHTGFPKYAKFSDLDTIRRK